MAWTIFVEDHQRNISAKLYGNRSSGFGQEDFYIYLYRYIGKISPPPPTPPPPPPPPTHTHTGGHVFWRIQMANNLGRGSPKEHFCQVILKSVQWFLTRRFLKFSILIYRENKPHPWRPYFLTNQKGLNNLGRGSPKEHFCEIILKWVQWFRTRRFLKFSI